METPQGHAERYKKTILVKKPKPRKAWTNRSTITVEKWCDNHEQICVFSQKARFCKQTRREQYLRNKEKRKGRAVAERKTCRVCEKEKEAKYFYKDPMCTDGLSGICKSCKKKYDKKRNDTWDALFRLQWRASLRAHGNVNEENPITLKQCKLLLESQDYKCNHCGVKLISEQGTQIDCSWNRASLDRIETNIVGYGSGNAQWLCVSCNKGKCTFPDEVHREKFAKRDRRIKELENEVFYLKKQIQQLEESYSESSSEAED
jgi:hypothetical protein